MCPRPFVAHLTPPLGIPDACLVARLDPSFDLYIPSSPLVPPPLLLGPRPGRVRVKILLPRQQGLIDNARFSPKFWRMARGEWSWQASSIRFFPPPLQWFFHVPYLRHPRNLSIDKVKMDPPLLQKVNQLSQMVGHRPTDTPDPFSS